jgi:5-methylcytosine-specific restriction endonuclease McrA
MEHIIHGAGDNDQDIDGDLLAVKDAMEYIIDTITTQKPIMMKRRKVNGQLGRNNTKDSEEKYNYIENDLGITHHRCSRGANGTRFGVSHEGDRRCPIRDFHFNGIRMENGNIICNKSIPLQGACKRCDSLYRGARIQSSRDKNVGGHEQFIKTYGDKWGCSRCKKQKHPTEFSLSMSMEHGIHNHCKDCSKKYGESAGDRIILYLPDGTFGYKKDKEGLHDDHIFPLALGGTNEEVNHQLILAKENLQKSSKIMYSSVHEIPSNLLCERWRHILHQVKSENETIHILKSRLSRAIYQEQQCRYSKSDNDLEDEYRKYYNGINKRNDAKRSVRIFKDYFRSRMI